MKIYIKKTTDTFTRIRIFGISVFKKEIKNQAVIKKFLFGIFKTKKENHRKKYYLLGIKVFSTKHYPIEEMFGLLKNDLMKENRAMLSVFNLHSKVFPQFKYCNFQKSVAIVGCGPTLNYYSPINDIIHIALNKAYQKEEINFDYLFMVDSAYKGNSLVDIEKLNCTKFLGFHCNPEFSYCNEQTLYNPKNTEFCHIPEIHVIKNNAYRFYSNAHRNEIFYDIETSPLMDFGSISFPALHFALYTHPKKIYLIGCDCAQNGYFDKKVQPANNLHSRMMFGYKKFKKFASTYYPDIEIISINPVGLKGLFKDVYTREYVSENPEILEQNPNITYLDELENKENSL